MGGRGTGEFGITDWTNDQSLLGSGNVLSPTGSSNEGVNRALWFPSDGTETTGGAETVAVPIGAGREAQESQGSASATPPSPPRVPDGGDWRADASERSGSGEPSSPGAQLLQERATGWRERGGWIRNRFRGDNRQWGDSRD